MRTFLALDLDNEIREQIAEFVSNLRPLAPDVRWVAPESLHVTLKFIGEKPDAFLPQIERALQSIRQPSFELSFRGCGFFPAEKPARVFWIGIAAGAGLSDLAQEIENSLAHIGIEKEPRAFSPHLTLARAGSGAPCRNKIEKPNRRFAPLQQKLAALPPPDFGTMSAREFFLYRSQLSGKGSRYTKIARFELRPADSQ